MPGSSQESGFLVTPKTITTILGVAAICGMIFTGVSAVNANGYRLDKLEAEKIQLSTSIEKLTVQIGQLNEKIVDLTITLNRVQDRSERVPTNGKASN